MIQNKTNKTLFISMIFNLSHITRLLSKGIRQLNILLCHCIVTCQKLDNKKCQYIDLFNY